MYLVLFTIIYCVITRIFNLDYALIFGIYLIGLSVAKGVFSKEIKDIFNLKKTSHMYEKIGFRESLMELVSLILIYINSYSIDYEPFTTLDFVVIFFMFIFVYRFLFWGTTMKLRKHSIESSHKK